LNNFDRFFFVDVLVLVKVSFFHQSIQTKKKVILQSFSSENSTYEKCFTPELLGVRVVALL
jgi:hypothetical protein